MLLPNHDVTGVFPAMINETPEVVAEVRCMLGAKLSTINSRVFDGEA